ncbi:unannotated protein [freshwater metagenome]|uniref:Unannotated protein n=1 Tax=freshwater metagenome TaxID=449393 RepID=A0A6J6G1A5_9ZZZZ
MPLGQLPLLEMNRALLLLSTQALTIGTDGLFAIANPLATLTPITNPVVTLKILPLRITAPFA